MAESLSPEDIQRLLDEPSAEARAAIASKVAGQFANVTITPKERELAHQILGVMLHDTADLVRKRLSQSLQHYANAPHDIVLALARDIDEVALPVLEASPVLTEEDLIELVLKGTAAKQMAIAKRPLVQCAVSAALVESGNRVAIALLAANKNAEFEERTLHRIVDEHGTDPGITEPLAKRGDLPITLAERLVALVSDNLKHYLVEHHGIGESAAVQIITESRERATVDLLDELDDYGDLPRLVEQLAVNGRLTPSLLLRAACMGEMAFLEQSLAFLTRLPVRRVEQLLHDRGALGLPALLSKARVPDMLVPAFRTAIDAFRETGGARAGDRRALRRAMLEKVLAAYQDLDAKDLDYLLTKLGGIAASDETGMTAERAL